jgi:hypothetical protein
MKTAAVFALKVVVLTFLLIIVFLIAINTSGMTHNSAATKLTAPTPAEQAQQAQQAKAMLPALIAYTLLISLVMAWIIQNARWRGLKLIVSLIFTFYGLMTLITQMETLAYLRGKMPLSLIKQLFISGAVVAMLFVPAAVLVMGRMRRPEEPDAIEHHLNVKTEAVRFATLAVVYMVLYYLFGYYVAWQNPEVRTYYAGSTELKSFFEQIRSIPSATPWMLPLQFGRGLLWALFAYPVARMLKTSRVETACTISALFGVWSFVLLLPNPLMPLSVTRSHFWETLWCDLILGAIVGWTLAADKHAESLPARASAADAK